MIGILLLVRTKKDVTEEKSNINVNQFRPIPQDSEQGPLRRKKPTNKNDDFFMHITDNTNSWLTIFHQNERGLSDKGGELICSLISSMFTAHFLCLSEHFITLQNLSTI
jgi:hypothetical protein